MGSVVVCGGSMIGLSAGLMLARDGHDVTVATPLRRHVPKAAAVRAAIERSPARRPVASPDRAGLLDLLAA